MHTNLCTLSKRLFIFFVTNLQTGGIKISGCAYLGTVEMWAAVCLESFTPPPLPISPVQLISNDSTRREGIKINVIVC